MKFYNSVDRAPALEPGEVVWANVLNPLENTKSRNKPRPAILLRRQGNGWRVMGLTTNPTYADGRSRVPVADLDFPPLAGHGVMRLPLTVAAGSDVAAVRR